MNSNQKNEMSKLFNFLSEEIPYYEELKAYDIIPDDVEEIYKKIPMINKQVIRKEEDKFISKKIAAECNDFTTKVTGGTTGEPWNITKTTAEYTRYFKMLWKSRNQFGITPKDHFYQFGGYGNIDGVFSVHKVIEMPHYTELSMFHLSDEVIDMYIDLINEGKGNWFFANPSALYIFAKRMKDRGIKGLGRIKYIELTGERVYQYQEEAIREVFDCPISIMYGSREITTISHRCKYGVHHILPKVYVDAVDENGNSVVGVHDTMGEVVITSFVDRYMPFVKYKTGDFASVGVIEDCPCGCSGQYFAELEGRKAAYATVNGYQISMEITYYLMDKYNREHGSGIRQFQARFKKPNKFFFTIVLDDDSLQAQVEEFYKNELMEVVPGVTVEVEFVKYIQRERRKMNPFIVED